MAAQAVRARVGVAAVQQQVRVRRWRQGQLSAGVAGGGTHGVGLGGGSVVVAQGDADAVLPMERLGAVEVDAAGFLRLVGSPAAAVGGAHPVPGVTVTRGQAHYGVVWRVGVDGDDAAAVAVGRDAVVG